jgi:hypothetical protein
LKPRKRIPKGVTINQYFGISLDEAGRAQRITSRLRESKKWASPHFPLIDLVYTRADCLTYLADKVPHQTPRSACVFCPYHSDAEWFRLREADPVGWNRAIQIDRALRDGQSVVNQNMRQAIFLHRSCQPLYQVTFDTRPTRRDLQMSMSFAAVCEGVCGV